MKRYRLTDKGKDLIPVLMELWVWGAKHDPASTVAPAEIAHRQANRAEILRKYQQ